MNKEDMPFNIWDFLSTNNRGRGGNRRNMINKMLIAYVALLSARRIPMKGTTISGPHPS